MLSITRSIGNKAVISALIRTVNGKDSDFLCISRNFSDASGMNIQGPVDRAKVIQVYKNLLHLGKDFPKGYEYFRDRLKAAFLKNRDVQDPKQREILLARAVFVSKELEALYMLKKYRTLKKRYYADELK